MANIVQLDFFINEQAQREAIEKAEFEKSVKSSVRCLFYRSNEQDEKIFQQQKEIDRLKEFCYRHGLHEVAT